MYGRMDKLHKRYRVPDVRSAVLHADTHEDSQREHQGTERARDANQNQPGVLTVIADTFIVVFAALVAYDFFKYTYQKLIIDKK